MKKNRHIYKIAFTILIFLTILLLSIFLFIKYFFSSLRIYEKNWDINFPSSLTETYSADTSDNWFGEGYSYTIYKIKGNTDFFDNSNGFSSEKNTEIESSVRAILKELNVEQKNYLNFEHNYTWKSYQKNDDQLYIFCDLENNKVYFIEAIL